MCPALISGHFLTLSEHPRADLETTSGLITGIQHGRHNSRKLLENPVTSDTKDSDGFHAGLPQTSSRHALRMYRSDRN